MWQDFGDYILSQAGDKPVKIAEIGVGKFDQISNLLSEIPIMFKSDKLKYFLISSKNVPAPYSTTVLPLSFFTNFGKVLSNLKS